MINSFMICEKGSFLVKRISLNNIKVLFLYSHDSYILPDYPDVECPNGLTYVRNHYEGQIFMIDSVI